MHIETDYKLPLRYGDALDIELTRAERGRHVGGVPLRRLPPPRRQAGLQAEITCACVNMDTFKACHPRRSARAVREVPIMSERLPPSRPASQPRPAATVVVLREAPAVPRS